MARRAIRSICRQPRNLSHSNQNEILNDDSSPAIFKSLLPKPSVAQPSPAQRSQTLKCPP
jgi:hypothetical protein